MDKTVLILILGMAIVTYIPRVVPAVLSGKMKFSPKVERFLQLLPYTAMAALIFPGIFLVDTEHYSIGIAGGLAAAILGLKKCPVMVCVLAAIVVDLILYLMI